jgi:hypothetical protein
MDRMRERIVQLGLIQTVPGYRLHHHLERLRETATWDDLAAMFDLYVAAMHDVAK